MLFSSALIALVGAGERAGESPRKLRLWNTYTETAVGPELCFPTAVLNVQLNRQRLVVVLESALHIFDLMSMQHLHTLPTSPNPLGLAALSPDPDTCHCATLTADGKEGQAVMYDHAEPHALNTVVAHRSKLHCLSLSSRGDMLATASEKGTVVRVHSFPQGSLLYTFRRGSFRTCIHSLSFSPSAIDESETASDALPAGATMLCAASSSTIHVWQLDAQRGASVSRQRHPPLASRAPPPRHRRATADPAHTPPSTRAMHPQSLLDDACSPARFGRAVAPHALLPTRRFRDSTVSLANVAAWPAWLPVPAERDFAFVRLKVSPGTRCQAAICPAKQVRVSVLPAHAPIMHTRWARLHPITAHPCTRDAASATAACRSSAPLASRAGRC